MAEAPEDKELHALRDALGAIGKRLDKLTGKAAADDDDDKAARRDAPLSEDELAALAGALAKHLRGPGDEEPRQTAADAKRSRTDEREETEKLVAAQTRADAAARNWGREPRRPQYGEDAVTYTVRDLAYHKQFSKEWAGVDLSKIADADPVTFMQTVAPQIYSDSARASVDPNVGTGGNLLREIRMADITGRIHTKFVGPVLADNGMITPFASPVMWVKKFRTPRNFDDD